LPSLVIMPRTRKSLNDQYHPTLRKFMGWRDNAVYDKDQQFTAEQIASITPEELVRWF
jgi:hypothetical protein